MAALYCAPASRSLSERSSSSLSEASSQLRLRRSVPPSLVTCSSAAISTHQLLQCPVSPPQPARTFEGDWNSRMLFSRGMGTVKDVDKDTLWDAVKAAGDKPVVLDMYSRWCGPCRLIYPKLVKLSGEYTDVVFLKLDCSAENKMAFSKLGIGILPTFKIFKNNSLVSEVKGAKYEELVSKIEKARAS